MPKSTDYRSNARCISCGNPLSGVAYYGKTQVCANKNRWLCAECFEGPIDVEHARSINVGAENKAGLMYSITLRPDVDTEELRFVMLEGRSNTWYVTGEHTYTSPTFMNTKWARRLEVIAELCPAGTMDFLVRRYDGTVFKETSFSWTTSRQLREFSLASLKKKG